MPDWHWLAHSFPSHYSALSCGSRASWTEKCLVSINLSVWKCKNGVTQVSPEWFTTYCPVGLKVYKSEGRFNYLRWCFQRCIWVSIVWAESSFFSQSSPLPVFKRSGKNQYRLTPKQKEKRKKCCCHILMHVCSNFLPVILTLKHMLSTCTFAGRNDALRTSSRLLKQVFCYI